MIASTPLDAAKCTSCMHFRVRFCETDLMGIVHHSNYLVYFEAGRVEWLRRRGVTYASWAARGIHLPVVEVGVKYRAPARFDDELELDTTLGELRAASVRFDYVLRRGSQVLSEGMTRLACIDDAHQIRRIPGEVHDVLLLGEATS